MIFVGSVQTIRPTIGIAVKDGDPLFLRRPPVQVDVKFDSDEGPRPETALADFELRDEVRRLMKCLAEVQNGTIVRIEVRAGIPRKLTIERQMAEASL